MVKVEVITLDVRTNVHTPLLISNHGLLWSQKDWLVFSLLDNQKHNTVDLNTLSVSLGLHVLTNSWLTDMPSFPFSLPLFLQLTSFPFFLSYSKIIMFSCSQNNALPAQENYSCMCKTCWSNVVLVSLTALYTKMLQLVFSLSLLLSYKFIISSL